MLKKEFGKFFEAQTADSPAFSMGARHCMEELVVVKGAPPPGALKCIVCDTGGINSGIAVRTHLRSQPHVAKLANAGDGRSAGSEAETKVEQELKPDKEFTEKMAKERKTCA